jgi:hypothetical protein
VDAQVDPQSPLVETVLDEVMRDGALHPGFREMIRRLVFERNDAWQACCGNDCDPCILPMRRAVEAARQRLGLRR